jgi:hypothetical protein
MTLHRAIIELPGYMNEPGREKTERLVFFESPSQHAYQRLVQLADTVWLIASSAWGHTCTLQDLRSEAALLNAEDGEGPATGDLRLLKVGYGWDRNGARYASANDCTLLVEPRTQARLLAAFAAAAKLQGASK